MLVSRGEIALVRDGRPRVRFEANSETGLIAEFPSEFDAVADIASATDVVALFTGKTPAANSARMRAFVGAAAAGD